MEHALAILAVWRLSSLLTKEDGIFDVFVHLRTTLYRFKALECFWCTSVWVGAGVALVRLWGTPLTVDSLLLPLAYSGGAILLHKAVIDG